MNYVVVKGLAIGQYTRGQVVTGEQLGDRLQKCLRRGIVRPATEADGAPTALDTPPPAAPVVPGSELHEARAHLATTEGRMADMEKALASYQQDLKELSEALHDSRNREQGLLGRESAALDKLAGAEERIAELEQQLAAVTHAPAIADAPPASEPAGETPVTMEPHHGGRRKK